MDDFAGGLIFEYVDHLCVADLAGVVFLPSAGGIEVGAFEHYAEAAIWECSFGGNGGVKFKLLCIISVKELTVHFGSLIRLFYAARLWLDL
ncbi:MAG TPA: hypothetical protein PKM21_04855 [Anaerolineales bacterium]|nr:hypothetical protein [Anaerolineales bacterium]